MNFTQYDSRQVWSKRVEPGLDRTPDNLHHSMSFRFAVARHIFSQIGYMFFRTVLLERDISSTYKNIWSHVYYLKNWFLNKKSLWIYLKLLFFTVRLSCYIFTYEYHLECSFVGSSSSLPSLLCFNIPAILTKRFFAHTVNYQANSPGGNEENVPLGLWDDRSLKKVLAFSDSIFVIRIFITTRQRVEYY